MAKKSSKKKSSKAPGKPPAKPAAKPAAKPKAAPPVKQAAPASIPKPATKASPKATAKVDKKSAKTSKKSGKQATAETPAPLPAAPPQAAPAKPSRKTKPVAAATPTAETPGRPAQKVHVHAGDSATDAPRGRSRKETSGPTHNGIGDAAVRKATGKGWAEWLDILDEAGAKALDHKAIVVILSEKHAASEWWAQMITVGYEQARGLRQKHEKPDGFEAGVSKTINAATSKLYKAWEDEEARERWMGEHKVEVRVANADKNIRMTWLVQGPDEGSSVEVSFWPKDANKCLVQVQQRKLADADAVQRVRAFWSVKLENLRAMMEKAG